MKRFMLISTMILGVVFLVLSIAGVVGVWVLRSTALNTVDSLFGMADKAMVATLSKMDDMAERRDEIRSGVAEISTEIEKAGDKVEETPVMFMAIDQLMDGKLSPAVAQLDQAGSEFYANLARLEATLKALNSSALFRDRDGFLDEVSENLSGLMDDMQQLGQDVDALKDGLQENKSQATTVAATLLQQPLQKIDDRLANSQARLERLEGRLIVVDEKLDLARTNLMRMINVLAVLLTLALVWLAVSQYLVVRYALQMYRAL